MLKRILLALGALSLALILPRWISPVSAANASCVASPASAPVGTTFALSASGFTPNAWVWLYAVEPDGAAFSDPTYNAFGGAVKANEKGVVNFNFVTRFNIYGYDIARAFGSWTLVAEELAPGGKIAHQANCLVTVTPAGGAPTGATVSVNSSKVQLGTDEIVYGSGFASNEMVNLWVSPPAGCSSFAFDLAPTVLLYQYAAASAYAQDSVKTASDGTFTYVLPTYSFYTCLGEWAVSAYAPGSKVGGFANFVVIGGTVPGGATLDVDPTSGYARGGEFTFTASGFTPKDVASCWLTRPDGTDRFVGNYKANASGDFEFSFVTGYDNSLFGLSYGEALGRYAMTCRDNVSGATGTAWFTLNGFVVDP